MSKATESNHAFSSELVRLLINHTEEGLQRTNQRLSQAAEFIINSHLNPQHYAMPIQNAPQDWIEQKLAENDYNAVENQLAFEDTKTTHGVVRVMVRTHLNRQYVRHVIRGAVDQTLTPRVMRAFEDPAFDYTKLTSSEDYAAHWWSIVESYPELYDDTDRAAIALLSKLKGGHWHASNVVANKLGMDDAWAKVLTGIYTGLVYLNATFEFDAGKLWKEMDDTIGDAKAAKKLAQSFQRNIHQYGNALSGSFLADLGHAQFVKPDTHVLSCVAALTNNDKVSPQFAIDYVYSLSEKLGTCPRMIDKIFYLGCSGQFYLYNIKIKNKNIFKQAFLERLTQLHL